MKLDYDCIRYILLSLENSDSNRILASSLATEQYNEKTILHHIECLVDVNYIEVSKPIMTLGSGYADYFIYRLTMFGHQYIDSIRDDKLWKNVLKTIGSKTSSLSLDIIKDVATSLIKTSLGLFN